MDPVLAVFAFNRVSEIDWLSPGGSKYFLSYNFGTATMQGYPAERIAPVKCRKVDDGAVVPELAPAVGFNWRSGASDRTISEVWRD